MNKKRQIFWIYGNPETGKTNLFKWLDPIGVEIIDDFLFFGSKLEKLKKTIKEETCDIVVIAQELPTRNLIEFIFDNNFILSTFEAKKIEREYY